VDPVPWIQKSNPELCGLVVSGLMFWSQGWKKPEFLKKKPAQWFFLVFFLVFWFFWGFFGFFKYICPEERVFRVFSVSRIL
jgi:hypothetical protein